MKLAELLQDDIELPALPDIYMKVSDKLEDEKSTSDQIGAVLQMDPVLSGKLLRMVNSAFYGLSREITGIAQAVSIVGRIEVNNLVLGAAVADMVTGMDNSVLPIKDYWRHSVRCALVAKLLGKALGKGIKVDSLFVAGLLHDVGRLVIANNLADQAKEIRDLITIDELEITAAERQVLEFDHTELGAELLKNWQLPELLIQTTRYHHHPAQAETFKTEVWIVFLANLLANIDDEELAEVAGGILENTEGFSESGLDIKQVLSVAEHALNQVDTVIGILMG